MHGKDADDHEPAEPNEYKKYFEEIEDYIRARDAVEIAQHAAPEDEPPVDSDYAVDWEVDEKPSYEQLEQYTQSLQRMLGEVEFADKEARDASKQKTRKLEAKVGALIATTELRKWGATKAYSLATGSISFWIVIVGFQAVVKTATGVPPLDDSVLIAITSGCTVNVLAAFLGVIRGLFPHKPEQPRHKRKSSGKD